MNIFRKLRWKLTFTYTIVTVSAFLVVILILGAIFLPKIFVPNNVVTPELMIDILKENSNPIWSHVLSQSPVDLELVNLMMQNSDATITSFDLLQIGSVQLTARTFAQWRALIIGADGTLFGKLGDNFPINFKIGQQIDFSQVQGLQTPLQAALSGDKDYSHMYTIYEPEERFLVAVPVTNNSEGPRYGVVGAIVVIFDVLPTQGDVPAHILDLAGRSLLVFLIGVGILGAIFGAFFAHGLSTRFRRLSTSIDAWSAGDFSKFIDDSTGDEISQFAQRLNDMAKQLQSLLRRRQEMAVSEERNRLARDLHDSAKQQALAASFELGTAIVLYDRDSQSAKKHLVEADALVDSVRKELTTLVDELRPLPLDGQDFSETLRDYAMEWSHRSGIELKLNIEGSNEMPMETRETLFRIVQEALANVTRHSSAGEAALSLENGRDSVNLLIKDNGRGFDTAEQHSGLGLNSMRERAEGSGGSFTVESAPGKGTQIAVRLPKASK